MMNRSLHLFLYLALGAMGLAYVPAVFASNCVPAASGTEVIASSCAFSGVLAGVDNGGITVNGGATLTINAGQTIVWSIGHALAVNGSVAVNTTGELRQSYLWMLDADADGWPANTAQVAQDTSPGSGYRRRSLMTSVSVIDCNDASASAANSCYAGNGADGVLTVSGTSYTDNVRTALVAGVSAGATTVSVTSADGFKAGDEALIMQMEGGTTGLYESLFVAATTTDTMTFVTGLVNGYSVKSGGKVQVIRIPNWTTVTVQNTGTLTAHPWDGSTGGVMYFRASTRVNVSGTISVAQLGFGGGSGGSAGSGGTAGAAGGGGSADTSWTGLCNGNSSAGNGSSGGQTALGGAGGGAGGDRCSGTGFSKTGGSGGTGGSAGGSGLAGGSGTAGGGSGGGSAGTGGTNSTASNFGTILMGGSGGGGNGGAGGSGAGGGAGGGGGMGSVTGTGLTGSTGSAGGTGGVGGAGGAGGTSGGIMIVKSLQIAVTGTITAGGASGSTGVVSGTGGAGGAGGAGGRGGTGGGGCGGAGGGGGAGGKGGNDGSGGAGGGGGAGGAIFLVADTLQLGSSLTTATGGSGGSAGSGDAGSNGTGGAGGSGGSAGCSDPTATPAIGGTTGSFGAVGSNGSAGTAGGAGKIRLEYITLSGTTNPTPTSTSTPQ